MPSSSPDRNQETLEAQAEDRLMDVSIAFQLGESRPRDFRQSIDAALELRAAEASDDPDLVAEAPTQLAPKRLFPILAYAAGVLAILVLIFTGVLGPQDRESASQSDSTVADEEGERDSANAHIHIPDWKDHARDRAECNARYASSEVRTVAVSRGSSGYLLASSLEELKSKAATKKPISAKLISYQINDAALEWIAKRSSIEILTLEDCNITDKGLNALTSLKKLRMLYLRECRRITTKGVEVISKMESLSSLALTGFVGQTASIAGADSGPKKEWGQPGSRLDDDACKHLAKMENLVYLDLSGAKVGDQGLLYLTIGNLNKLEMLNLNDTGITDRNLALIHTPLSHGDGVPATRLLPSLKELHIRNAAIGDEGLASFVKFIADSDQYPEMTDRSSIEYLEIGGNGFNSSKITDAGIAELAKLPKLWKLKVSHAHRVSDKGWQSLFEKCSGLRMVELHDLRQCGDLALGALGSCKEIVEVKLTRTPKVSDAGLLKLVHAPNLSAIDLSWSQSSITLNGIEDAWHLAKKFRPERNLTISYGNDPEKHHFYTPKMARVVVTEAGSKSSSDALIFCAYPNGKEPFRATKWQVEAKDYKSYRGPHSEFFNGLSEVMNERSDRVKKLTVHDCIISPGGIKAPEELTFTAWSENHGGATKTVSGYSEGRLDLEMEWPAPRRGKLAKAVNIEIAPKISNYDLGEDAPAGYRDFWLVIHTKEAVGPNSCAIFRYRDLRHSWGRSGVIRHGKEPLFYTLHRPGAKPLTGEIPARWIEKKGERGQSYLIGLNIRP